MSHQKLIYLLVTKVEFAEKQDWIVDKYWIMIWGFAI